MTCSFSPVARARHLPGRRHLLARPVVASLPFRAGDPSSILTRRICFLPPIVHAAPHRPLSSRPTGLAPRRLGTHSPPPLLRSLYLLQCFPHLSPPSSELRLGRVPRRLDRVLTVVQPIGLTSSSPRRLTAHRPRGRGSEGLPYELYSAHPRVYGGDARDGTLLGCDISLLHHIRFPLVHP